MTDFQKIKEFFLQRCGKFVEYSVIDSDARKCEKHLPEYVCQNIINNPGVKDFFVLNFPFYSNAGLVEIDSFDSFVFEFYFIDYGDKIVISDAKRTFDCGVEEYEGNGVILAQKTVVEKYLLKNGLQSIDNDIVKQTSLQTFVQDTVAFVKALQTLNNAQPYPPYILELDSARETVDALTRCWVYGERIDGVQPARKLALFDSQKNLLENFSCAEDGYPPIFNKHAFTGLFFNSDGKVLVKKTRTDTAPKYDFAIHDFVLQDEDNSLIAFQRAIKQNLGLDFYFGELAPALTTTRDKLIFDFYVVHGYDVAIEQLHNDSNAFEWIEKDKLFALLKADRFANYPVKLLEYLCEL